jgi:hypothetical protein
VFSVPLDIHQGLCFEGAVAFKAVVKPSLAMFNHRGGRVETLNESQSSNNYEGGYFTVWIYALMQG